MVLEGLTCITIYNLEICVQVRSIQAGMGTKMIYWHDGAKYRTHFTKANEIDWLVYPSKNEGREKIRFFSINTPER